MEHLSLFDLQHREMQSDGSHIVEFPTTDSVIRMTKAKKVRYSR